MREIIMVIIVASLFALLVMQVVENISLCFSDEDEEEENEQS